MIPKAHITEWRSKVPWALDEQVEQDLIISRALVAIFTDPYLKSALAFRGGTALHKLHFAPAGRYSEDIDLVQVQAVSIGPVLNALRGRLDHWLGKGQVDRPKKKGPVWTITYKYPAESVAVAFRKLKVEINTREHQAFDSYLSVPFQVNSRWFTGEANLTTFSIEELLATKLRCLFQRKKGRDAFDLDRALHMCPAPDSSKIVRLFLRYMEQQGNRVSRAEFEMNLAVKRKRSEFLNDILPLLATGAPPYDPLLALDRIEQELVALLPGAPWQRPTS